MGDLGLPVELVLRLVSVLGLAGLACLVWIAARNAAGIEAAAVAAAVMISSNIVIEKTVDGYPDTFMLLFLMAGWLVWFSLGVGRGRWNMAWVLGFFFCGLAFYTKGFIAILYFIFPLIFMRRPMTIWRRLKKPGFILGIVILLLFIMLWWMPHLVFAGDVEFKPVTFEGERIWDYLEHVVLFPVDMFVRFLPWSIIAWVPFCVAFIPLDRVPIFSRFLRTLFFALFFILLFMPDFDARSILLLTPPVAILTGMYYGFFTRRYGRHFPQFYKYVGWTSLFCAAVILVFYLAPAEWLNLFVSVSRGISFRYLVVNQINAFAGAAVMILIGLILLFYRKLQIWVVLLLSGCVVALFLWSLIIPYKAQAIGKRVQGRQFREALQKEKIPADEIIYKSAIKDLYGECYYMGYRVKKIYSVLELPKDKEVIYLISTDYPQLPTREWTNLLPENAEYRGRPIGLRRGVLKKRQFKKWPQI
jgi:4-amino-4-deoxy-L-arabinose transferase-like glycosyltransferase